MAMSLASRWWLIALRGAAAIVFGILTFISPGSSLFALVILFGAYALVDGVFNVVTGLRSVRDGQRWGWLLFQGIIGVAAGVLTLFRPGVTAMALLWVIASWAIITGIAAIAAAIRLRKHIEGEWLLGLSGVLSIVFGGLMFAFPGAGALAVTIWIGAYALVLGVMLVALGFRVRSWAREAERHVPMGGAPQPA